MLWPQIDFSLKPRWTNLYSTMIRWGHVDFIELERMCLCVCVCGIEKKRIFLFLFFYFYLFFFISQKKLGQVDFSFVLLSWSMNVCVFFLTKKKCEIVRCVDFLINNKTHTQTLSRFSIIFLINFWFFFLIFKDIVTHVSFCIFHTHTNINIIIPIL